jgi:hypothetical protein
MKFRQIATAITTFAAITAGTAAMAQDSSQAAFDAKLAREANSTLTRAEVLADLKLYQASGLLELQRSEAPDVGSAHYVQAQAKYAQLSAAKSMNASTAAVAPTRAEVVADLKRYQASGLLDLQRGETVDVTSAQYLNAQAKYAQLTQKGVQMR